LIFKDSIARRAALKAAYDKQTDGFRCHFTGLLLDTANLKSPFYLSFDHPFPGDSSKFLACARFINELKSAMSEPEFRANISLLARCFRTGERLDPSLFRLDHYRAGRKKPSMKAFQAPRERPLRVWYAKECLACGLEPLKGFLYCQRCRRILFSEAERTAKREALRKAYDAAAGGFRCHYTGVLLDLGDTSDPWHLSFDHRLPGRKGNIAVTSVIINNMKSELSDGEFRKVVVELAKHFETGEPYDRDVIGFEYWDRPRMPRP
jgi:hypothetical protein